MTNKPSDDAINKFNIGDKIQPTKAYFEAFSGYKDFSGLVVGFSRDKDLIRIRKFGKSTPETIHQDFIEVVK